jgi:hypothetical protein
MPSEAQLEHELTLARHDLEANLIELQLVVREKLDVRRRARVALAHARARALAFMWREVVIGSVAAFLAGLWFGRRHRA